MPVTKNIFIYGNSITYGEWDEQGGWANRIRAHFDRQVLPVPNDYIITYNLGIPSDTSAGIANRIENETRARLEPNPAVRNVQFVIATGANDSRWLIEENRQAVSIDEFKNNMRLIRNKAQQFSDDIIFVGLLPCIEDEVKKAAREHSWVELYYNDSLSQFNDIIQQVSQENNHTFVDLNRLFIKRDYDDLFSDGLHPNSKGHELIAQAVIGVITSFPRRRESP